MTYYLSGFIFLSTIFIIDYFTFHRKYTNNVERIITQENMRLEEELAEIKSFKIFSSKKIKEKIANNETLVNYVACSKDIGKQKAN